MAGCSVYCQTQVVKCIIIIKKKQEVRNSHYFLINLLKKEASLPKGRVKYGRVALESYTKGALHCQHTTSHVCGDAFGSHEHCVEPHIVFPIEAVVCVWRAAKPDPRPFARGQGLLEVVRPPNTEPKQMWNRARPGHNACTSLVLQVRGTACSTLQQQACQCAEMMRRQGNTQPAVRDGA